MSRVINPIMYRFLSIYWQTWHRGIANCADFLPQKRSDIVGLFGSTASQGNLLVQALIIAFLIPSNIC